MMNDFETTDDLGCGYTALANLCDYPIDVVKIDRDILLKTNTERGEDLFFGIIALAHSLNMSVVCEGVETEEQNTLVSRSDCDYIQGWYYVKALPLDECELFAQKYVP
jgi:EAL domain-containing protein (putative c-di-GMP-specific phosphodiesterase class I)